MSVRALSRGLTHWVALLTVCAAIAACGDGDDPVGCTVSPAEKETQQAGTLIYSVQASAISDVLKVVYAGPNGRVTVDDPELPFSVSLSVKAGTKIHLEVTGVAPPGGKVAAGYSFSGETAQLLDSAECQH